MSKNKNKNKSDATNIMKLDYTSKIYGLAEGLSRLLLILATTQLLCTGM